jgi:peroxiredoxin Q/BCP
MIREGEKAPDFTLPAVDGSEITLSDLQGKYVILYFYPKDMTPGCTQEACDFRDAYREIQDVQAEVIGISRDPIKRHQAFVEKHNLPFQLLSDELGAVCQLYEVIKEKNLFGKKVKGIERSTFIIDPEGRVAKIYRRVKVKDHVQAALQWIKQHQQQN